VLRVARTLELAEAVERERAALEAAQRAGAPVPAVFDRVEVDGRPGLVLERLEPPDLLVGVLRRPWRLPAVPDVLAELQAALHETPAPPELPEVHEMIAARLGSKHVPPRVRDAALRALERLPRGDRLCHGDFHPGNVLHRGDGYAVVDWRNAARGDPAADIAWTRLLMVGAWIPGLGPRWAQLPLAPPRLGLYLAYRRAYDRRRHVERRAVAAWVPAGSSPPGTAS
jgi:aminoglycoside phosphotransferase (APT) family kinase protein